MAVGRAYSAPSIRQLPARDFSHRRSHSATSPRSPLVLFADGVGPLCDGRRPSPWSVVPTPARWRNSPQLRPLERRAVSGPTSKSSEYIDVVPRRPDAAVSRSLSLTPSCGPPRRGGPGCSSPCPSASDDPQLPVSGCPVGPPLSPCDFFSRPSRRDASSRFEPPGMILLQLGATVNSLTW